MSRDMAGNLEPLTPSRKRLRSGDVFTMRLRGQGYLFGRVVDTDAIWTVGDAGGRANLLYVYKGLHEDLAPPQHLAVDDLLIPPLMTNGLGWSRGYFQTVENRPLTPASVLPRHCFRRSNGEYYDERGQRLSGPVEPVGEFALHSFRTIDDAVSIALGIPLAPD